MIISILNKHLFIPEKDIIDVSFLGGMTNKNYLAKTSQGDFVVRIAGTMTDKLIERRFEAENSLIMSNLGLNVETLYIDQKSGVKVTRYLSESKPLDHQSILDKSRLKSIAQQLKKLHNFSNSAIQQFSNSAIQQFSNSAIQQFSNSAIQQFSNSAIQQFSNSAIQQ
ncbi:hypothetical protein A4G18_03685 [Pasteurellaceae bacterium Pebbles2]|nr:hypothetical protein [Pasteurellaceae bacterium Pebbles2]